MKGGRYDGPAGDEKFGLGERSEPALRPGITGYGSAPSLLKTNSNTSPPSDPPSPNYVAVGGQDPQTPADCSLAGEHQGLNAHFAWRGDAHATPAIRG